MQILILQVFFSSYIFKANVMVQVATQQAANPVSDGLTKLHVPVAINSYMDVHVNQGPKLRLPGRN